MTTDNKKDEFWKDEQDTLDFKNQQSKNDIIDYFHHFDQGSSSTIKK